MDGARDVSSRAKRNTFRRDTQSGFVRDQGRKISLFHTKGEKLNERIVRKRLNQIREKRSRTRAREKHLLEQIEITNNRLSESIGTAEQALYADLAETRAVMETNVTNNAERINAKIEHSDTKNRSSTGRIRELLERLNERASELKKSIEGVVNEIRKIRLFKKASKQVSFEKPTIRQTPRR